MPSPLDLANGKRIDAARLHGVVVHMRLVHKTLYAATDVGDHLTWDLSALYAKRCELLRRVWREVPVVWEKGKAVRRAPPKGHPCLAASPNAR